MGVHLSSLTSSLPRDFTLKPLHVKLIRSYMAHRTFSSTWHLQANSPAARTQGFLHDRGGTVLLLALYSTYNL